MLVTSCREYRVRCLGRYSAPFGGYVMGLSSGDIGRLQAPIQTLRGTRAPTKSVAVPSARECPRPAVELSDGRRFTVPVFFVCPDRHLGMNLRLRRMPGLGEPPQRRSPSRSPPRMVCDASAVVSRPMVSSLVTYIEGSARYRVRGLGFACSASRPIS